MLDPNTGLEIPIKVTADVGGATQAEAALKKVGAAADQAGGGAAGLVTEAKEASTQLRDLGRAGHDAEQVLVGLDRGGISGLLMALRGLGSMAKLAAG